MLSGAENMRGQPETFDDFVIRSGPALVRVGTGLAGGDRSAGEDLAQEALARCWVHWRRSSSPEHPEAYARRVLVNLYLKGRQRRTREQPTEYIQVPTAVDQTDHVVTHSVLWQALAALSRAQRAVLVLRYYEDLPDERIAELLGCPTSTVRSHAARGLARLRTATELEPSGGNQ